MERNITLDYFKFLLCLLVITIHIQPLFTGNLPVTSSWIISNGIARIAVPCFFIINGYYLSTKISNWPSVKKYLKKCLIIYFTWSFIYLNWFDYTELTISRVISFLIMGYYHLWYLASLIMAIPIFYLIKRWIKNDKVILCIVIILYFSGYAIQFFAIEHVTPSAFRYLIYRNALFLTLPFVFLGYYIKKTENILFDKLENKYLIPVILIGCALIIIESYGSYGFHSLDFFAVLFFVCPAIFFFVIKNSTYTVDDGYTGQLASGIYYVHLIAIFISKQIANSAIDNVYLTGLIFFMSLILSSGIIEVNKRIKVFL